MKRKYKLLFFLLLATNLLYSQVNDFSKKADSLYYAKQYNEAAWYYIQTAAKAEFNSTKASASYNAACCFALSNKTDSAFIMLTKAIKYGYSNKQNLLNDSDLKPLHGSKKWAKVILSISDKQGLNSDPVNTKFVTADIYRFWKAYDLANKDTAKAYKIYKQHYFDKGTKGMQDYMAIKVRSINKFIKHIATHPKLYTSIRENTIKVESYKSKFLSSFQNFKAIYPNAQFPDVYFVIGSFTSAGTVSGAGLLIGVNQICKDEHTNLEELDFGEKLLINKLEMLPHIIAHELIHFQQAEIVRDTITLGYAINEGMADFLGELISGKTANPHLQEWIKGKEKKVWERFKGDMYYNRYDNWIGNYDNASDDNFPDLAYWIGYEICKSYYENTTDKKQAIYDMLHIKSFKQFLAESKWEEKLNKL